MPILDFNVWLTVNLRLGWISNILNELTFGFLENGAAHGFVIAIILTIEYLAISYKKCKWVKFIGSRRKWIDCVYVRSMQGRIVVLSNIAHLFDLVSKPMRLIFYSLETYCFLLFQPPLVRPINHNICGARNMHWPSDLFADTVANAPQRRRFSWTIWRMHF